MQSKITKLLASGVLLLLVVLAVAPLLIGRNVQAFAIDNTLALLPPEMRSQVEIQENSFAAGWFRSTAALAMEYQPLGALPLRVNLAMDIQHGPLLFTSAGPALGLVYATIVPEFDSADIRRLLRELPFALPETDINLRVGLRGDLRIRMDIAPLRHADASGQLDFGGIQAWFIAYPDLSAESRLDMGLLTAQESGQMQITIEGLTAHTATAQMTDLLAPGSMNLHIPTLRSTAPYPFDLLDLSAESRVQPSRQASESTDIFQRIEIARIDSDLPLDAFSWTSEINETRNDLFRRYYVLLVQLQDELDTAGGTVSAQVTQSAEELALLLLQNRIVLNNALTADAYGGDHAVDLRLVWQGLPDLVEVAALDLNAALAALNLTLDLSFDLEAIMRSPLAEFVDPYVQQGYLQLANGRILLRAVLADSELTLNDEPISLDGFL